MRALRPSLFLTLLLLAGCGGGGAAGGAGASSPSPSPTPTTERAQATLNIVWPARLGRVIPAAANGLTVDILQSGSVVQHVVIGRPTSGNTTQTTFSDLPVGVLDVSVKAFPNADGTGVAQGVGTGSLTTSVGVNAGVTVSLVSTAATLAISPVSPQVGKGSTQLLTASAKDANNNIVLLSSGGGSETLTWTTNDPTIATVSGTGPSATLSGLRAGTVQVSATLTTNDSGGTLTGTGTPTIVGASGTVIIR